MLFFNKAKGIRLDWSILYIGSEIINNNNNKKTRCLYSIHTLETNVKGIGILQWNYYITKQTQNVLLLCFQMTVLAKLKSETSKTILHVYTLSPTSTIACFKIQTGTVNHVVPYITWFSQTWKIFKILKCLSVTKILLKSKTVIFIAKLINCYILRTLIGHPREYYVHYKNHKTVNVFLSFRQSSTCV